MIDIVRDGLTKEPPREGRAALAARGKTQQEAFQEDQGTGSTTGDLSGRILRDVRWQALRSCLDDGVAFQRFGADWCEPERQRRLKVLRDQAGVAAQDSYIDVAEQRTLAALARTLALTAAEESECYENLRSGGVTFQAPPILYRAEPPITSPEALVRFAMGAPARAQQVLEEALEAEQLDGWFAKLMLQGQPGHRAAEEATKAYHESKRLPATKRVGIWRVLWCLGYSGFPLDSSCRTIIYSLEDLQSQLRARHPKEVLSYALEWGLLEAWLKTHQRQLNVDGNTILEVRRAASGKMTEKSAWTVAWQLGAVHINWGKQQLTTASDVLALDPEGKLPSVSPDLFLLWLRLGLHQDALVAQLARKRAPADDLQRTLRRAQWALGLRRLKVGAFVVESPDTTSLRNAGLKSAESLADLGDAVLDCVLDDWIYCLEQRAGSPVSALQLRTRRDDKGGIGQSADQLAVIFEALRAAGMTAHQTGLAAVWCLGENSLVLWARGTSGGHQWLRLGGDSKSAIADVVERSTDVWPVAARPDAVADLVLWTELEESGLTSATGSVVPVDDLDDYLASRGDTTLRFVTGMPLSEVAPAVGGLDVPFIHAKESLRIWLASSPKIPHAFRVLFQTDRLQAWLWRHDPDVAEELDIKLEGVPSARARLDIAAQALGDSRLTLADDCVVETIDELRQHGPGHLDRVAELFEAGALSAWAPTEGAKRLSALAQAMRDDGRGSDLHRALRRFLLHRNLGALTWAAVTGESLLELESNVSKVHLSVADGPAVLRLPFAIAKLEGLPTEMVLSDSTDGNFKCLFWVSAEALRTTPWLEIPWYPTASTTRGPRVAEFTLSGVNEGGTIAHQTVSCLISVRYPWARLALALRDILFSSPQIAVRSAALWLGTWAFLAFGDAGLAKTWPVFKIWTSAHFASLAGFALWATWTGLALGECFAERTSVWPSSTVFGNEKDSESISLVLGFPLLAYVGLLALWITSLSPLIAWWIYNNVNWHVGTFASCDLWFASLVASLPLGVAVPAFAVLKSRGFEGVGRLVLASGIAVHVAPWLGV